jgi:S1-C subfamily serine protease
MFLRNLILVVSFLLTQNCFSQVGLKTGHWDWSEPDGHHKSIIKVIAKTENSITAQGTGVVIGENKVLTAQHVVDGILNTFYIKLDNGKEIAASVGPVDFSADLALIVTKEKIPLPVLKIAKNRPKECEPVEVCGFGAGGELRHFHAQLRLCGDDRSGVDGWTIPGDSGGPIFNKEKEIIGIVSGGIAWSNEKGFVHQERVIKPTWPIRCSSWDAIKSISK